MVTLIAVLWLCS